MHSELHIITVVLAPFIGNFHSAVHLQNVLLLCTGLCSKVMCSYVVILMCLSLTTSLNNCINNYIHVIPCDRKDLCGI